MWLSSLFLATQILAVSAAHLRTLNWNISWVSASPDGFTRPFIGINGQWPAPELLANVGDILKINAYNGLVNETTSIHFHGIFNNGTNMMDGPAMVTQCPIAPGETFVYEFQVFQTGTYWYHAHIGGQYIDGFRGPMIIHDPAAPFKYDDESILTLTDLYHDQAPLLINYYLSPDNENNYGGTEPVPNANLINEAENVKFPIIAGKTYLFHIINMGAYASQWLQFGGHNMTIVEVDGVYTQPYNVSQLFVAPAQRYSVLIHAKTTTTQNFVVVAQMETDMFDSTKTPANQKTTATGWLVYNSALPLPTAFTIAPTPFDDTLFLPYDKQPILGPVTNSIYLTADFSENDQNQVSAQFNGISYVPQKVPTLFTALTAPANLVNNTAIYGTGSNPYLLSYGDIVELTVSNHDNYNHPFHLHGHNFQVVDRSGYSNNFPGVVTPDPPVPMRRDTVMVYGGGYATIRFKADNPGIALFHCHIEWHVEAGLTISFIEAPEQLQALKLRLPDSHNDACKKLGIPLKGNAAGNYGTNAQWLNLTGANTDPVLSDWGALINPPKTQPTAQPGIPGSPN